MHNSRYLYQLLLLLSVVVSVESCVRLWNYRTIIYYRYKHYQYRQLPVVLTAIANVSDKATNA